MGTYIGNRVYLVEVETSRTDKLDPDPLPFSVTPERENSISRCLCPECVIEYRFASISAVVTLRGQRPAQINQITRHPVEGAFCVDVQRTTVICWLVCGRLSHPGAHLGLLHCPRGLSM
jgi:hypothetical protein